MLRQTQIEYSRCSASPELNNILSHHPSLALDFHIARTLVAGGMTAKKAIKRVRLNGPITTSRESLDDDENIVESLNVCLGNIASGGCVEYPKLAL